MVQHQYKSTSNQSIHNKKKMEEKKKLFESLKELREEKKENKIIHYKLEENKLELRGVATEMRDSSTFTEKDGKKFLMETTRIKFYVNEIETINGKVDKAILPFYKKVNKDDKKTYVSPDDYEKEGILKVTVCIGDTIEVSMKKSSTKFEIGYISMVNVICNYGKSKNKKENRIYINADGMNNVAQPRYLKEFEEYYRKNIKEMEEYLNPEHKLNLFDQLYYITIQKMKFSTNEFFYQTNKLNSLDIGIWVFCIKKYDWINKPSTSLWLELEKNRLTKFDLILKKNYDIPSFTKMINEEMNVNEFEIFGTYYQGDKCIFPSTEFQKLTQFNFIDYSTNKEAAKKILSDDKYVLNKNNENIMTGSSTVFVKFKLKDKKIVYELSPRTIEFMRYTKITNLENLEAVCQINSFDAYLIFYSQRENYNPSIDFENDLETPQPPIKVNDSNIIIDFNATLDNCISLEENFAFEICGYHSMMNYMLLRNVNYEGTYLSLSIKEKKKDIIFNDISDIKSRKVSFQTLRENSQSSYPYNLDESNKTINFSENDVIKILFGVNNLINEDPNNKMNSEYKNYVKNSGLLKILCYYEQVKHEEDKVKWYEIMKFIRSVYYFKFIEITQNISEVSQMAKEMTKLIVFNNDSQYNTLELKEDSDVSKFNTDIVTESYSKFMSNVVIIPYWTKKNDKKRKIETLEEECSKKICITQNEISERELNEESEEENTFEEN